MDYQSPALYSLEDLVGTDDKPARVLDVSAVELGRLVAAGEFPVCLVGVDRKPVWRKADVDAWLRAREEASE